jgi:hypothetical protein
MAHRLTVDVEQEVLDTLETEARRRGVRLTALVAEAVEDKVASIRSARRPRAGLGRSTDGQSAADLTAEPVTHPPV